MAKSYWNTNKEDLLDLCEKRELHFKEKPSQREIVHALFDWDKEFGHLEEVVEEDEEGLSINPNVEKKREDLMTVIFHNTEREDVPYVFIGFNGRAWYIPKDIEVTIPKVLITSVIADAVETRITPKKNKDGKIVYDHKKIQRFPYTVVDK